MAETNPTQPAGDAGKIDVAAITKTVTEQVTAAFKKTLDDLGENQRVISTTVADLVKTNQAAAEAAKSGNGKDGKGDAPEAKVVTAEEVGKIVADAFKARETEAASQAGKSATRKALREKVGKEKLGGDAELIALLPDSDDEAAMTKAADALAAKIKTFKPDFGGAAKEGGTPPNGSAAPALNPNLPPGVAKFAASLKAPTAAEPAKA